MTRARATSPARLLATAEACLAPTGSGSWSVRALARRAGCSRGTIYRHFGSLLAVEQALIASLATSLADAFETGRAGDVVGCLERSLGVAASRPALATALVCGADVLGRAVRVAWRSRTDEALHITLGMVLLDGVGLAPRLPPSLLARRAGHGWLRRGQRLEAPAAGHEPGETRSLALGGGPSARERILLAAKQTVVGRLGTLPPFALLAARAGVGVATLFREFRGHAALYSAAALELRDAASELGWEASTSPDGLVSLTVAIADILGSHAGLGPALLGPAASTALRGLGREVLALLILALEKQLGSASACVVEVHGARGEAKPLTVLLLGLAFTAAASTGDAATRRRRAWRWSRRVLTGATS